MTSKLRYRRDEDRGATAVLVGVSFLVLVGIAAFVLDIGNLFWERRSLQNGADAAALAVAQDCALGDCGDARATAAEYASANNPRGAHINSIDPEDVSPEDGEVTVTAETGDDEGAGSLATWFASVIGTDETATSARATAVWEQRALDEDVVPLTASLCDFMGKGIDEIDVPDDLDDAAEGLDREPDLSEEAEQIILHNQPGTDPDDLDDCTAQPGFSEDDSDDGDKSSIRAGFGWLESTDCEIDKIEGPDDDGFFWAESSSGVGDKAAKCIPELKGQAVDIPIFTGMRPDEEDSWPDEYRLYVPAAFYITDYWLPSSPGNGGGGNGGGVGGADCQPNACIEGHWVSKVGPGSTDPDAPDFGVRSVRLDE